MSESDVIELLDELDRRKAAMPDRCPSWCIGDHVLAIEEGCSVETARVHKSPDFTVGRFLRIEMHEDHIPHSPAEVFIEITYREEGLCTRLGLSTPEARSLARLLTHLADEDEIRRSIR